MFPAVTPLRFLLATSSVLTFCLALPLPAEDSPAPTGQRDRFTETLSGTTVQFDMVRVPAGLLVTGSGEERTETEIASFWIGETEVTWDAYDVFVFHLDEEQAEEGEGAGDDGDEEEPDALARPTKPYIATDHGFGHAGYPAISISYRGARAYCAWLSEKTGRRYRLPTTAEWEYACRAGSEGKWSCGDDEKKLAEIAWYRDNSERKTHAVGEKPANAFGLHDMHGNAAEWCTDENDQHYLAGGSFTEPPDLLACTARRKNSRMWNVSDPQIPRSIWWLADGPFAGLRVVCEDAPEAGGESAPKAEKN